MKTGIIGTGTVGQTLASRLVELGYDVMLGTRNVESKLSSTARDAYGNPPFSEWIKANPGVRLGTFAEAAAFGGIVINATHGASSLDALKLAGAKNLSGKVLMDISNPLDFSNGMPPRLISSMQNSNSLGEEIQKNFPDAKVVKTLNTMWCGLMLNPDMLAKGDHVNFISGNDEGAKKEVKSLLRKFGWKEENLLDLGDITAARATESVLPIWLRVMGTLKTGKFNFKIVQ